MYRGPISNPFPNMLDLFCNFVVNIPAKIVQGAQVFYRVIHFTTLFLPVILLFGARFRLIAAQRVIFKIVIRWRLRFRNIRQ